MANMSYCRFRNTLEDLQDCDEHLYDDDLSIEEKQAREELINLSREITEKVADEPTGEEK